MTAPPCESLLVAIETSGDLCGVAVLRDGDLAVEQTFRHHMHLSEVLLQTVQTVLEAAGASLNDVTEIGVGIGPGSFTGTRIGVMTAKTLSAVRGIPLYGVIGLEALAWSYRGLEDVGVVPILPCRTGVVFAAAYAVAGEGPTVEIPPDTFALEDLLERVVAAQSRRILLCGGAAPRYGETLRAQFADRGIQVFLGDERSPRAALVGSLAHRRVAAKSPSDSPFDLVPLYLSPPPITMPKFPIPQ